MEVVAAARGSGPVPPFQRRDVQEWSRLDQLTGMLEHARLEHDHWTANTPHSTHQYGKVVDLRDRSGADGKIQQRQRKQLEVYRSQVPGGSLQVIRTQTLATTSSKWTTTKREFSDNSDFENLHLALNPLDLSSQKTKASVGRSGSIGGRRPPTRPRKTDTEEDLTSRLHRVTRLCQQIHSTDRNSRQSDDSRANLRQIQPSETLNQESASNSRANLRQIQTEIPSNQSPRPSIHERQSGDGSVSDHFEIESVTSNTDEKEYDKIISQNGVDSQTPSPIEYNSLINEELKNKELNSWRSNRFSPEKDSKVNKIKQDLETGRRLNTALRGNNVDLEALDQILKSISPGSSGTYSDTSLEKNSDDCTDEIKKVTKKRHSFITVESLKEVKGRLRRLSSPIDDFYGSKPKDEDPDDGIASEDNSVMKKEKMPVSSGVSRVRSYVYGMETMLGSRKPVVGTGSLESRTSGKLNNSMNRSEDWYNRRKSYGFEQVHNQNDQNIPLHAKSKIESSTDSGICRSTEIVLVPPTVKTTQLLNKFNRDTTKSEDSDNSHKQIYNGSTIINVGLDKYETKNEYNRKDHNELINMWNRRASFNSADKSRPKESEQITITIPIVSEESTNANRKLYHRQFSENSSVSIEQLDTDFKRHSIAVDESKYVSRSENKFPFAQLRRTSLIIGDKNDKADILYADDEEGNGNNRKTKKVEFCKTEVHFAAESGRVNIVETDEKPPPTNNFRRRRRNSGITNNQTSEENKNGLPMIHFGDTNYEKQLFSVPDHDNIQVDDVSDSYHRESPIDNMISNNTVTVSSVPITSEPILKEPENENQPRGILKNRMIKPRPYLLGLDNEESTIPTKDIPNHITNEEQESPKIWGVRLRPVQKEESPMWRSTVTVQNTSYQIPVTTENTEYTKDEPKYDSDSSQSDIKKMLSNLHAVRKTENYKPPVDLRRSSWSVADRIKQVENLRWTENKGYSTKVNFGSGEATVVEIDKKERQPVWPNEDDFVDEKKILNKGLVVRIGKDDSNHTVCSKTTTNGQSNNTTTTTKITIDMSPSPSNNEYPLFSQIKLPRASLHSLKSTSLIINTISNTPKELNTNKVIEEDLITKNTKSAIPDQLAALKKLYEEASEHSDDSELDEEVRSYMSGGGEDSNHEEARSVVSGSWSKMRAFRAIKQHLNSSSNSKENEIIKNIINHQTNLKRDFAAKTALQTSIHKTPEKVTSVEYNRQPLSKQLATSVSVKNNVVRKINDKPLAISRTDKRQIVPSNKIETKNDNLSSPMLVGNSLQNVKLTRRESVTQKKEDRLEKSSNSINKILVSSYVKNVSEKKTEVKKPVSSYYARSSSPKREATPEKKINPYYNAIRSPKLAKKYIEKPREELRKNNKPDLLQYIDTNEYVNLSSVFNNDKNHIKNNINKSKSAEVKHVTTIEDRAESPVYENIDDIISTRPEKESSIIQELTRAADEILQAVNGYTDDDSLKYSTDDEDDKKNKYRRNSDVLETITESKSWKKSNEIKKQNEITKNRRIFRATSSTSSLESVTKEYKPQMPVRPNRSEKLREERAKKKLTSVNPEVVKVTKQRRLQRASSREALLQSHGSSSEDLSQNEPIRKPRLVRRNKTQSASTTSEVSKKSTSQPNYARKREIDLRRSADRVPVVGLQEIRHKTAISTIRSTAEKAASRDKAIKGKTEDLKKKNVTKSSFIRGNSKCVADRTTRTTCSRESGSTVSAIRTSSGVAVKKTAA